MTDSVVVYESIASGERYELELPLEIRRDLVSMRADLGLPGYVELDNPQVGRAIAILWAAHNIDTLARQHEALSGLPGALRIVVFGGVGIRFLCPSANRPSPFKRSIGDLDLMTTGDDGRPLVTLLTGLDEVLGSRLWHVETQSDAMFNALRRGRRYRVHAAKTLDDGSVDPCILDVVTDAIEFCHRVVPSDALNDPAANLYTIGATELLLTKLQAISAIAAERVPDERSYRVIGELGDQLLLGPEDKDIADAAALLVDYELGVGEDCIDRERFGRALERDWGLARTVKLNLANCAMYERVLNQRGADQATIAAVRERLDALAAVADDPEYQPRKPRLRFSRTWWETVEDHEHD